MSADQVLTNKDLVVLTKYKQRPKQCAWLAAAGIWFSKDRNGGPVTTWSHVNNPIPLRHGAMLSADSTEPNFDAM